MYHHSHYRLSWFLFNNYNAADWVIMSMSRLEGFGKPIKLYFELRFPWWNGEGSPERYLNEGSKESLVLRQYETIATLFGIINWVDNVNWPLLRVSKLTFRALALRQSKWRRANARKGQFTLSAQLIMPNWKKIYIRLNVSDSCLQKERRSFVFCTILNYVDLVRMKYLKLHLP